MYIGMYSKTILDLYKRLAHVHRAGHIALWNRSITLERTLILGAMVINKKKSEERGANWQNPNSERFAYEQYKEKRVQ